MVSVDTVKSSHVNLARIDQFFKSFRLLPGESTASRSADYKNYAESVFRFSYPADWRSVSTVERAEFTKEITAQSKELFLEYHGKPEGYDTLLPHVFGFVSPNRAITVVGVLMRIPPQATDYIAEVYARGSEVIEWGVREGKVKQKISHDKTMVGAIPAVRSEVIFADRKRSISMTFHFSRSPTYGGILTVIVPEAAFKDHERDISRVFETFTLEEPKGR